MSFHLGYVCEYCRKKIYYDGDYPLPPQEFDIELSFTIIRFCSLECKRKWIEKELREFNDF